MNEIAPTPTYNRRKNAILLEYWESLCKDGKLPRESDIDFDVLKDLWENCFLIQMRDFNQETQHGNFTYLGKKLSDAYGEGALSSDGVPNLVTTDINSIHEACQEVQRTRQPVTNEGTVTLHDDVVLAFRQCLVPLTDGKDEIFSVLGRMEFHKYAD